MAGPPILQQISISSSCLCSLLYFQTRFQQQSPEFSSLFLPQNRS
jgi:hypothetical protein